MLKKKTWKRLAMNTIILGAIVLPAATASAETITVKTGDTLFLLAKKYQITVDHLKIANHLASDGLNAGISLYIPPKSTIYTVQSGDTLWKISQKFSTTIAKIKEINPLMTDYLNIGEKILLVSGQAAPAPTSTTSTSTSTTVPTVPTPIVEPANQYTVVSGDVLWKISAKFGVSIQALIDTNKLTTTEILIGQKLIIPGLSVTQNQETTTTQPSTETPTEPEKPSMELINYSVKKGDNAWTISIQFGIPMSEFLKINNFNESTMLLIGQVVKIPVHHIPVTSTPGPQYGEYLDWFDAAQYLFPINAIATVTDYQTGKQFKVKRTIGAFHSDTEPLTAADSAAIKEIWGGTFSWKVRPVIVEYDGRRLAASMTSMPHSIEYILDNDFPGHFDIHFPNSLRHNDGTIDQSHQAAIKIAAGK